MNEEQTCWCCGSPDLKASEELCSECESVRIEVIVAMAEEAVA